MRATNTNPAPVPPPGSDAAIKAGCTCPVLENAHGEGFSVTCDSDYCEISRAYYIKRNCPVHDPLPDLTMRPRTGAGGAHAE